MTSSTYVVPCVALAAGLLLAPMAVEHGALAQDNRRLEQAAKDMLYRHCARCHQDKLGEGSYKERPAGNFGYVLEIEQMIEKGLLTPGNPEASSLYIKVQTGDMPKDKDDACIFDPKPTDYCGPTDDEVKALHEWVSSIQSRDDQIAERQKSFITDDEIIRAMADDLSKVSNARRSRMRYFTLTHLYNAGDDPKALEVYGYAIAKMLNSLSKESDPARVVAIDKNKTVFRVDIYDLGWDNKKWDMVVSYNPYMVIYDNPLFHFLQKETYSVAPFLRADWFAFVATQPPLYYDLLDMPKHKRELERYLGVNVARNIDNLKIARAGFQKSGVSQNNRMIERHTIPTGAYWESYDFAGNADRQSFFKFPLGPEGSFGPLSQKYGFDHDGGEMIFDLPNGFHAYYLTDNKGGRLDKGPTEIVLDPSRRDQAVTNGVSCMGCHDLGIKYNQHRPAERQDQVREQVLETLAFPKEVRDIVEEIFPPHEEFHKLMKADESRYEKALARAGIPMGAKVYGVEMVNALFKRFEQDMTPVQAGAELGFTHGDFKKQLMKGNEEAYALGRRLENGLVPRDQFVKDFASLVNQLTDHKGVDFKEILNRTRGKDAVVVDTKRPPQYSKTFDMVFYPNQEQYRVGQTVTFTVKAESSCYLTLINQDDKGRAQVVFPNRFNQNNKIDADVTYSVPGGHIGGFKFTFTEPGKEKVIAICNATRPDPAGILHNFKSEAYTTFRSLDEYVSKTAGARSRLLAVTQDSGGAGSGKVAVTDYKTGREKQMPALISNPVDPHVDILAQKSVVMNVRK